MPKYFQSRNHMLAYEATATLLILESLIARSIIHGMISDKLAKIHSKASNRAYRRWLAIQISKK